MGEVIFIGILLACLIIPFAVFKLWGWFWTMCVIGVVVGVGEIWSKIKTGMTLSQNFWRWSSNYKEGANQQVKAWIVLVLLGIGWLTLLVHLAWKMLTQ